MKSVSLSSESLLQVQNNYDLMVSMQESVFRRGFIPKGLNKGLLNNISFYFNTHHSQSHPPVYSTQSRSYTTEITQIRLFSSLL